MPTKFGNGLNIVTLIFQFRSQFPEFDSVLDGDVVTALNTAALFVDPLIWSAGDYGPALLNLAAHFTALKQMQIAASEIGGTGETDIFVRSISFGERHVQFQQRQGAKEIEALAGPGESLLSETIYGANFIMLRARNVSQLALVATAARPDRRFALRRAGGAASMDRRRLFVGRRPRCEPRGAQDQRDLRDAGRVGDRRVRLGARFRHADRGGRGVDQHPGRSPG
jgi:hypothetical protein